MYNFSLGNNSKNDPYSYDVDEYIDDDYDMPLKKGVGAFGIGKKKTFSSGLGISKAA